MKIECPHCQQSTDLEDVSVSTCPHCGSELSHDRVQESAIYRFGSLIWIEPHYYVQNGEEEKGPYSYESLDLMWDRGELKGSDLLRKGGDLEWIEVNQMAPKFSAVRKNRRCFKLYRILAPLSAVGSFICWHGGQIWGSMPEQTAIRNAGKATLSSGPVLLMLAFGALALLAFFALMQTFLHWLDFAKGKRSLTERR